MKNTFVLGILVLFCLNLVCGEECGSVPSDGCLITTNTVFEKGVYFLPSGFNIWNNDIVLDCNGASIIGDGSGNGILNPRFDDVSILNCNVSNYSRGIYLDYTYNKPEGRGYSVERNVLSGNILSRNDIGIGIEGHSSRYPSRLNNISKNVFESNINGVVFMRNVKNMEVFGNEFLNNVGNGIVVGETWNSLIYDNIFNLTGVNYAFTNGNDYCLGDLGNEYTGGASGPSCGCMDFIDGLTVSSNENFCRRNYHLPSGIKIGADGVVLDCNGSTFIGEGSGDGIYNKKFDHVEIKNCDIKDYTTGIRFHFEQYGGFGRHAAYVPDNCILSENVLESNRIGIGMYGYTGMYNGRSHQVFDNIFLSNSYSGIEINSVINSYFYGNRFLLNNNDAWDFSGNYWNTSSGGNYWDDYDEETEGCFDFDRDFVCDERYNIDGIGGSVDYLPLIDDSCAGKINVFVSDSSGYMISDVNVSLGNYSNSSNKDGFVSFDVNGSCDSLRTVKATCSNGKVCGEKSGIISYNGDVDSMNFVCDVCRSGLDVFVDESELKFRNVDSGTNVSFVVHSVSVDEKVNVSLVKSCHGVKSLVGKDQVLVSSENTGVFFIGDLDGCESIDVLVEVLDGEDFVDNNFIRDFKVIDPLKVYLKIDSGYSSVDEVLRDYLGDYVEVVSKSEAELEIYVGKGLYAGDGGYLDSGLIRFEGVRDGLPWEGVIDFSGSRVFVFGNEVEGTVAAVRELVEGRENYLNGRVVRFGMGDVYLGRGDVDALSVYDFLHLDENEDFYGRNGEAFALEVDSVLRRKNFDLAVKRVYPEGFDVSLRMKNLNFEMSDSYRSFVDSIGRPVVMAGGLFSNLVTWESGGDGLAFDLARDGKDVWEIEITGGEAEECDSCYDYSYEDLVDSYWPALIAGVQHYSGAVSVDYVGHSNGCRVALSSLGKYQENGKVDVGNVDGVEVDLEGSGEANVVGTFVGVGCPGELNGGTFLSGVARENIVGNNAGDIVIDSITDSHIKMSEYTGRLLVLGIVDGSFYTSLLGLANIFSGDDKISRNLMGYYNDLAIDEESDFDLGGLSIDKLRLYGGNILNLGHDGVVPVEDMGVVLGEVDSENENREVLRGIPFDVDHIYIKNKNRVKNAILEDLK